MDKIFCSSCGAANDYGAKFCEECGSELERYEETETSAAVCPEPTVVAAPLSESVQSAQEHKSKSDVETNQGQIGYLEREPQVYREYSISDKEHNKKKPKSKLKKFIIFFIIIILLASIGVGGYFIYNYFFKVTEIDLTYGINEKAIEYIGNDGDAYAFLKESKDDKYEGYTNYRDDGSDDIEDFIENVYYEVLPDSDLRNGDEITIVAQYSEHAAEQCRVKVVNVKKKIKVKGLKKPKQVNLIKPSAEAGGTSSGDNAGEYIFKDSNSRLLTRDEVKALTAEQRMYARNEIYARHGYIFKDSELKEYFGKKPWYKPSVEDQGAVSDSFNSYEKQNLQLILQVEKDEGK